MERFLDLYQDRPPLTTGLAWGMLFLYAAAAFWEWTHARTVWWLALIGEHSLGTLLLFGARSAGRVAQGEMWRLLTSGFVHGGILHVGVNCLALVGLGRIGETVFGSTRFFWIFLLSITGGALLAQMSGSPLSFGASGGLFGIMGALLSFGWTRQHLLPANMVRFFGTQLAAWTLLNLAIGFVLPFISNASHIGGLITGLAAGAVHADRLTGKKSGSDDVMFALLCGGTLLLCFGCLLLS